MTTSTPGPGIFRRGSACLIDVILPSILIGLLLRLGWWSPELLSPPDDWYWTEWWIRCWLEQPSLWAQVWAAFAAITLASGFLQEALLDRTLGARCLGLGIRDTTGLPASRRRLCGRWVATLLSWASLGLGFLWIYLDPEHRSWHDVASGTRVIQETPNRNETAKKTRRDGGFQHENDVLEG